MTVPVTPLTNENVKEIFKGTFRSLIIGSSESGKSYFLTQRVLPNIQDQYDRVFIFTRETNRGFYEKQTWDWRANKERRDWVKMGKVKREAYKSWYGNPEHKRFVAINTSPSTIQANIEMIAQSQNATKLYHSNGKVKKDELGNDMYKYKLMLIFDDVIDERINKSQEVINLFTHYRHINISTFMLLQTSTVQIPTIVKNQTTILVMAKMHSSDMRKRIMNEFVRCIVEDYYSNNDDIKIAMHDLYKNTCKDYKYGLLISNKNRLYHQCGNIPAREIEGWNDDYSASNFKG